MPKGTIKDHTLLNSVAISGEQLDQSKSNVALEANLVIDICYPKNDPNYGKKLPFVAHTRVSKGECWNCYIVFSAQSLVAILTDREPGPCP